MPRLLVYSRTTGYRHDSIPAGIRALQLIGAQAGCDVDATEDPAAFTPGGLSGYAVVIFLSTSGDVLDDGEICFVGATQTLRAARRRIETLAKLSPGQYVIYNGETGERLPLIAKTEPRRLRSAAARKVISPIGHPPKLVYSKP